MRVAYQLPSSVGSNIFSALLLSARMLRRIFSHFAFCFGCQFVSNPHRRAQASFQLFCPRPGCSGVFSAILLFVSVVNLLATLIGGLKHLFSYFALRRDAQAYFQPFWFLVRVLACQLPSSAGSSIFSAILLSAGMLRRIFSHFAFCFGCQLVSYPHRWAQASFQLFCSPPGCSGVFSAILLFVSVVSLLATLIGGLKHLFSYFALRRDAQAYFQPFCFLVRVLACQLP